MGIGPPSLSFLLYARGSLGVTLKLISHGSLAANQLRSLVLMICNLLIDYQRVCIWLAVGWGRCARKKRIKAVGAPHECWSPVVVPEVTEVTDSPLRSTVPPKIQNLWMGKKENRLLRILRLPGHLGRELGPVPLPAHRPSEGRLGTPGKILGRLQAFPLG